MMIERTKGRENDMYDRKGGHNDILTQDLIVP